MTFTVTVAARAKPRVKALRGKAKDKFSEAVNRLKHEGCAAGDYRMRASDGSDAHMCGLRFYADWRMHILGTRLQRGLARCLQSGYPCVMVTLVLDPHAPGLDALKERRRVSGLDRLDEVWEGVLHMVPAPSYEHAQIAQQLAEILGPPARAAGLTAAMHEFNLGDSEDDYRIPDGGLHRPGAGGVRLPTAALVVEIVSSADETWQKLPFYAAHDVDEALIVDPAERAIHWLGLDAGEYHPVERSGLINLGRDELAERVDWPYSPAHS